MSSNISKRPRTEYIDLCSPTPPPAKHPAKDKQFELTAALGRAINNTATVHLRLVLRQLANQGNANTLNSMKELLLVQDSSVQPSAKNNDIRSKVDALQPRYSECQKCRVSFDVSQNGEEDCLWHTVNESFR